MELFKSDIVDKSKWKSYKFEEIAHNINEKVDPTKTNLEIYVGLEHLDSETIHIRRYGKRSDVKGAKLRVYPGDIIFGRRRAYQRKASIANFNGFCSAHALVLRAKKDVIHPRLFPFFLHSDQFMNRAVDISVGSLSPTINWGTLKNERFLLPPKEEQEKIAELLWKLDEYLILENNLLKQLKTYKIVSMNNLLNGLDKNATNTDIPQNWLKLQIKDLGIISTSSVNKKIDPNETEVNLINYMDVYKNFDKRITSKMNFMKVTATDNQLVKNQVRVGDVLFTPSSETVEDIGISAVVIEDLPNTLYSYHLVRLSFFREIELDFKRYIFNNPRVLQHFSKVCQGVTRMTLGINSFYNTQLLIPPIEEQKNISRTLKNIDETIIELNKKNEASKVLQKSLIGRLFS